jgi:hypothetical protein
LSFLPAGFFASIDWRKMITFKCINDLKKLQTNNPALPIIKQLVDTLITLYDTQENPYIPEYYGYIVLIEKSDVSRVLDLPEANCRLLDVRWEFVEQRGDFFYAASLINDEFGLAFVIPDADWLSLELRALMTSLASH